MTFPNWYSIEQIAFDGHHKRYSPPNIAVSTARRKYSKSRRPARSSKSRLLFAISILVLLSAVALYSVNVRAMGDSAAIPAPPSPPPPTPAVTPFVTSSPVVLVSPGNVPVASVGSTSTIQVKVQNMSQFNGWDIEVQVYSWVINATSLSISGNDFAVNASSGSAFEIVHCVNGHGTGCTSSDGPGIVHSAYGNTGILTGNGLLFTITYKVLGPYAFSPIGLENDLISSPSSGNGVPHASTSGTYGVFAPTGPSGLGGGGIARLD